MKTRSGLLINTKPKHRQSANSKTPGSTAAPVPSTSNQKPTDNNLPQSKNPSSTKSMSNLSFVTRFLLNEGIGLKVGIEHSEQRKNDSEHGSRVKYRDGKKQLPKGNKSSPPASEKSKTEVKAKGNQVQYHKKCRSPSKEKGGRVAGPSNDNNSNSNDLIGLKPIRAPSPHLGKDLEEHQAQVSQAVAQTNSKLAARHPVLLHYISRSEFADAAASLLTLATGHQTTPTSIEFTNDQSGGEIIINDCIVNHAQIHTSISDGGVNEMIPFSDKDSDNASVGHSTNEDDSSSMTSQSSTDETYIQQASELDDTFIEDLTCFQLESHEYSYDTGGNKIHRCTVCERVFTVFAAFRTHVNTHVRPKNRCPVCGKIFSRTWLLKGHMRTHTGERPYPCKYNGCSKRFADKSNLRSHELIHSTKEKAFVCGKCKRAFAQKRYLHKHELEVCKF